MHNPEVFLPPPKCEPWELVLKAKNPVLLLPLVPLPELKTGGRLAPGYKAKLESSSVLLEPSWPQKEITAQKKKKYFSGTLSSHEGFAVRDVALGRTSDLY